MYTKSASKEFAQKLSYFIINITVCAFVFNLFKRTDARNVAFCIPYKTEESQKYYICAMNQSDLKHRTQCDSVQFQKSLVALKYTRQNWASVLIQWHKCRSTRPISVFFSRNIILCFNCTHKLPSPDCAQLKILPGRASAISVDPT